MSASASSNVSISRKALQVSIPRLVIEVAIVLLADFLLAHFLSKTMWDKHLGLVHTCLELLCVLVSFSIFMIVWQTFKFNLPLSQVYGFGFLVVALLNIFHTYYFQALHLFPAGYYDLATRFWIVGRMGEAFLTVFITYKLRLRRRINRWIALVASLTSVLIVAQLLWHCRPLFPELLVNGAVTPTKVALEYVIMFLYLLSLYNLRHEINERGVITYKYIFIASIFAIMAELSLTLFTTLSSYSNLLGHVFKFTCYVYFWRGIFASAITYPFEALEQSNRKTTVILNELPCALMFYDKHYRLSFANRRALEMLAVDEEVVMGREIYEMTQYLSPIEGDGIKTLREFLQNPRNVTNVTKVYKNHQGQIFWVKMVIQLLDNGEIVFNLKDARSEQILENLQLQTETILNAVNHKVVMWDVQNKILMCNNAFQEWFGQGSTLLVGMDWDSFRAMIQFNKPRLHEEVKEAGGKGKGIESEVSMVLLNGERKNLLLTSSPIYDVMGDLIGYIDVFNDITDLKQEQQRRIQQEKLAVIGQLGAGVVHECKNFLATVKGNSQLLKLATKDEKTLKYADRINQATEEMNRILTDLLTLAKPRIPVPGDISPGEIIRSMENILRSSSFLQNMEVEIIPGEERIIWCDDSQIRQVILNICKNAAEAMAEVARPLLRIWTGVNEEQGEVFVKISDNGKGIPDDILAKIGTPFFTTKETGTGLGLNICYQMVKENGGRIEIDTQVDEGTTFTIIFPAKVAEKTELSTKVLSQTRT